MTKRVQPMSNGHEQWELQWCMPTCPAAACLCQVALHTFHVSQSPDCVISVTVSNETQSGQHKVKVSGLIVSEQAGLLHTVQAAGAFEYVADIAAKAPDGKFNVLNHVRLR